MRGINTLLIAAPCLLSGCGLLRLDPAASESRPVVELADDSKSVFVPQGMVWRDSHPPTRGLRFPPGIYVLEAEDDDYWYFRSPAPLEFRDFKQGKLVSGQDVEGGLMIGKGFLRLVPAAGYVDGAQAEKLMVWKLGKSFVRLQGKAWTKSF